MPICGDGKLFGNETCDDGGKHCNEKCDGPISNWTCKGESKTTPSVCSCESGFELKSDLCLPICGDGFVIGDEKCDDKKQGGCTLNCTGPSLGYECKGGNATTATVC